MSTPATSTGQYPSRRLSARKLRRALLTLAILATVTALFYTVENWRGSRAWARFKAESAARGMSLDWTALIPPPVPDDQNFFKAPNMRDWFTGRGFRDFSRRIDYGNLDEFLLRHGLVPSVDVTVVPANAPASSGKADLVLQYNPPLLSLVDQPVDSAARPVPNAKARSVEIAGSAVARMAQDLKPDPDPIKPDDSSPILTSVLGPSVVIGLKPLAAIPPRRIVVRTDTNISTNEIKDFIPAGLRVISTGTNSYRVSLGLPPYIPAADYVAWSDSFQADFAALHAAVLRPYARMDGSYEYPPSVPIPNFISTRSTAQMLALRAQCYLLLGEPDKALGELTQMHDLCRLLEGRPTGEPMTLVAAMINVAIKGLYVSIIGDGLRLHAWGEPQLAAIQQQLVGINLLPYMYSALHAESLSLGRMVEVAKSTELADAFHESQNMSYWEKLRDPIHLYCRLAPHGWLLQNAVIAARIGQTSFAAIDPTNHLVFPKVVNSWLNDIHKTVNDSTPYNYLAVRFVPNYLHAMQALAKSQTLVNEALVVCGLERYRLLHGNYPETPDALVPQFVEKLPRDIFGGQPLKYRVEGGKFVLYSIGWNETDEGGVPCWTSDLTGDLNKNDWVWPYQEKSDGK